MAENRDLGHFIPVACEDLKRWLSRKASTPSLGKELTQVFELMAATIHFEYHKLLIYPQGFPNEAPKVKALRLGKKRVIDCISYRRGNAS